MIPFADFAAFAALPRITGLALSVDGSRLVAVVQQPDEKGARYASALWEVPLGEGVPRRLTHSEQGETAPVFRPDGSLLFVSSRPHDDEEDEPALWSLPPTGEPQLAARRPGGLGSPVVAARSGAIVCAGSRLAGSTDDDDEQRRRIRKDRKISAVLHTGMPVRHWDRVVDDELPRLLLDEGSGLRDLVPDGAGELADADYSITADGSLVATTWRVRVAHGRVRHCVALLDLNTGRRDVLQRDDVEFHHPRISPDGRALAMLRESDPSFAAPPCTELVIASPTGDEPRVVELGDLHPGELAWSADSATLFVAGDLHGRGAVVAVDAHAAVVTHSLATDASYSSLCPDPGGRFVYALRSAVDAPPVPVRLEAGRENGQPHLLATPAPIPELPGELVEVSVRAADGAPVHGWLCVPRDAPEPAPVMLWIHGGPFSSWNAWSWRWNPWVAVAHGWAVVLPDPALSTGYGHSWLERAWPYLAADVLADCEAVLDHVLRRADVDANRVACLGASFGGYMTNWIAGHTDRFGAIVTHAGLWALDQQHKTTDAADYKTTVFGEPAEHPEWYAQNSPHHGADAIRTPMLVVHGDRDFRVPLGEALRLWSDLVVRHSDAPETMPHRFLELTGENHWVLSPANAEIWYHTVLGFCAQHVLGKPWTPSELL